VKRTIRLSSVVLGLAGGSRANRETFGHMVRNRDPEDLDLAKVVRLFLPGVSHATFRPQEPNRVWTADIKQIRSARR